MQRSVPLIVVSALVGACGASAGAPSSGTRDGSAGADAAKTADAAGPDAAAAQRGLTWQDPPAPATMSQTEARSHCDGLRLDGHEDWRLPTITELRAAVEGCPATALGGACTLVDEGGQANIPPYSGCKGCPAGLGPGEGGCYWRGLTGPCATYWSTTDLFATTFEGHALDYRSASIETLGWFDSKTFNVRCVRGPL